VGGELQHAQTYRDPGCHPGTKGPSDGSRTFEIEKKFFGYMSPIGGNTQSGVLNKEPDQRGGLRPAMPWRGHTLEKGAIVDILKKETTCLRKKERKGQFSNMKGGGVVSGSGKRSC